MALRDLLIAPRAEASLGAHDTAALPDATREDGAGFARRAGRRTVGSTPSLGVLANARDLPAVAVAAGVVVARGHPAALVCVHALGAEPSTAPLRAPARAGANRLAGSLRARGLTADARGRVAVVELAHEGQDAAGATARALAAAGALPTVIAVAARDPDLDALLAAQDAVLVALSPSIDPALAELTVTSAARLARTVESVQLTLDPASRALAVGGLRAPAAVRAAVEDLIA
jgi:hypothetical protein